jgi:hypothetical protein
MVVPGAYGVKVSHQERWQASGEDLAAELGGIAGGKVLKHDDGNEDAVARGPGRRRGIENAELQRQVSALSGDGGVDASGVELQVVKLVRRENGNGTVGGGAELEGALGSVMEQGGGAEELGESAGPVAAQGLHLPKAVLRGDIALGEDQVVEIRCGDVRDAVAIALHGDGSGEARDGEGAIQLRKGITHGIASPDACAKEGHEEHAESNDEKNGEVAGQARGLDGYFVRHWVYGIGRVVKGVWLRPEQIEFVGGFVLR